MPAPTITALPDAPLRSEDPATFNSKAEAFVDALEGLPAELNALGTYLESLESGTLSPLLAAISGAGSAANKGSYYSGTNTVVLYDLTSFGRTLAGLADAAALRTAAGLVIGTNVQAYSANLATFAGIAPSANVQSVLGAADYAAIKTLLALTVGTDIPARSPSIQSVTSSATVTPTFADDQVNITAQAAALNLANPTGTAIPAWGMVIRIKDNGTARAITYNGGSGSQYRAIGVTLPTTTVISKTLYLGMVYNSTDTKWDVVAVAQEA